MLKLHFLLPAATATAVLFSCANFGGIGHEGEARITGQLFLPDGAPASQTRVALFPEGYDPVKEARTTPVEISDAQGNYQFSGVSPGDYTILAIGGDRTVRTLITGVHITRSDVAIPAATVRRTGAMKVLLPSGVSGATGYVYIPGTLLFAFLNNRTDFVVIDSVPSGDIPEVAYSSTNAEVSTTIRYSVSVPSGDTAVVRMPSWKYSRKFVLNTSATGANVAGDVADFPVLVRLNTGNFDFSQARTDGADIRFTKSDNTSLSYEIERWDAAKGVAELWVRVDTVRGGDSAQSITMYWGNPDAPGGSSGAAVFDTANGFAGVWHLGPPAGSDVKEATANGINGTATATTTVSGAIGMAQSFDGASSLIRTSVAASDRLNFSDSGTYSISAWVTTKVLDTLCHAVVFKSNAQYGIQLLPEHKWEITTYIDKTRWEVTRAPATANTWYALTGVRNGAKQYLYVNGVCVDSSVSGVAALPPENIARVYNQPFEIGHCPDAIKNVDRFFNGTIDEVRISKVALKPEWIKLCYMNQKERDALVKW